MAGEIKTLQQAEGESVTPSSADFRTGGLVYIDTVARNNATLSNSASHWSLKIDYGDAGGGYGHCLGFSSGGGIVNAAISAYDEGTEGDTSLVFITGNSTTISEAMRIDKAQNVGIGQTPTGGKLDVLASDDTTGLRVIGDSDGGTSIVRFINSHSTISASDTIGEFFFSGTNTPTNGASYIFFRDNDTNPTGKIEVSGSGVNYNTASDKRLKKDFQKFYGALDTVNLIESGTFEWISRKDGERYAGVLAQDLEKVYPYAVSKGSGKPGEYGFIPYSVDYAKITPILISAIQELAAKVEALEARA